MNVTNSFFANSADPVFIRPFLNNTPATSIGAYSGRHVAEDTFPRVRTDAEIIADLERRMRQCEMKISQLQNGQGPTPALCDDDDDDAPSSRDGKQKLGVAPSYNWTYD